MPIANRLKTYLEQQNITYKTRTHAITPSSARTAEAAHIPGGRIAKAVVLKKPDDTFILMVLPADYRVHLGRLRALLEEPICLATEDELVKLFPDCSEGAIPALGPAYGLRTLVDRSLFDQPEIFMESGDHETLVQLSCEQLYRLIGESDRINAARHI